MTPSITLANLACIAIYAVALALQLAGTAPA